MPNTKSQECCIFSKSFNILVITLRSIINFTLFVVWCVCACVWCEEGMQIHSCVCGYRVVSGFGIIFENKVLSELNCLDTLVEIQFITNDEICGLIFLFFFCLWMLKCSSTTCWKDCYFPIVLTLLPCQKLIYCIWVILLWDFLLFHYFFSNTIQSWLLLIWIFLKSGSMSNLLYIRT